MARTAAGRPWMSGGIRNIGKSPACRRRRARPGAHRVVDEIVGFGAPAFPRPAEAMINGLDVQSLTPWEIRRVTGRIDCVLISPVDDQHEYSLPTPRHRPHQPRRAARRASRPGDTGTARHRSGRAMPRNLPSGAWSWGW